MQLPDFNCVLNAEMPVGNKGQFGLTQEQIRGVAPDYNTYRLGDELAQGGLWETAGRSVDLIWAVFAEGRRVDTQTVFFTPDLWATCNCGATRFPCRHIIALLLRSATDQVAPAAPPGWVDELRGSRFVHEKPKDFEEAARITAAGSGILDLERRLSDLMQQGFAGLKSRRGSYWSASADRLADAYLPDLAHQLRELDGIPDDSADWPERLLNRLGRLALLVEGFNRLDRLSPELRGDLLAAAGIAQQAGDDLEHDEWLVIGRYQEFGDRLRKSYSWLRGITSHRWALLLESVPSHLIAGYCYPVGSVLHGMLAFDPGSRPMRACVSGELLLGEQKPVQLMPSADIDTAISDFAEALALNPWIRRYPFLFENVWVELVRGRWRLRDQTGTILPFVDRYPHGWQLLAVTAGKPVTLFGEWNGREFTPFSLFTGSWHHIPAWRSLI